MEEAISATMCVLAKMMGHERFAIGPDREMIALHEMFAADGGLPVINDLALTRYKMSGLRVPYCLVNVPDENGLVQMRTTWVEPEFENPFQRGLALELAIQSLNQALGFIVDTYANGDTVEIA